MNAQPDLLFREIFSFFTFKEKIKLKSVCRRWNDFISCQLANQRRLLVYEKRMTGSLKETYGSPHRPVRFEERVERRVFLKFLENGQFKNLKVLYFFKTQIGTPTGLLLDCLLDLEELFIYSSIQATIGKKQSI